MVTWSHTCMSLVIIIPLIWRHLCRGRHLEDFMLFIPSSGRQTRSLRSNMKRTETERLGKGCYIQGGFTICEYHNKQGCDVWCVTVSVTAAVGSFVTWRALQLLTWHREQLATAPSSLQQQENWGKCVLWWLHYSDYPQSAAVAV